MYIICIYNIYIYNMYKVCVCLYVYVYNICMYILGSKLLLSIVAGMHPK